MKTNSIFNRRILLIIALALFPLLASEKASAQPANGVLTQMGTGLTSFTINLATTTQFTLTLNIQTTFSSLGITWYVQSNDGSGLFAISARDITGSSYGDVTTPTPTLITFGLLNPVNGRDIGATADADVPMGTVFVANLTLSLVNGMMTTPGVYHLFLDSRGSVGDTDFVDHVLNPGNVITITIVPEPATTGLAVLGGVMLLAFVWKARRVMA